MKKTYQKPTSRAHNISVQQLLADSGTQGTAQDFQGDSEWNEPSSVKGESSLWGNEW